MARRKWLQPLSQPSRNIGREVIRSWPRTKPEQHIPISVKWRVCTRQVYKVHLQPDHSGKYTLGTQSWFPQPLFCLFCAPILLSNPWLLKLSFQETLQKFLFKGVLLSGTSRQKTPDSPVGQDMSWCSK